MTERVTPLLATVLLAGLVAVACETGCTFRRPSRSAVRPSPRVAAVLINGGARRRRNYRSHLRNLREMVDLLRSRGVEDRDITIFSADGDDPTPDLAVGRDAGPEGLWLLPRRLRHGLRSRMRYRNSTISGFRLRPARREEIQRWFDAEGRTLGAGDTLLLYVTDHGGRGRRDGDGLSTITLWHESLEVSKLRVWLDQLDSGVRVVMLMSQCFSGGFAAVVFSGDGPELTGWNRCGYFAATADRPAYGCYTVNRGRAGVGYSFQILSGLRRRAALSAVHESTLLADVTPDVPHTTYDVFLARLFQRESARSGRDLGELIDDWLQRARARSGTETTRVLLLADHIARRFGLGVLGSLQDTLATEDRLRAAHNRLRADAERWRQQQETLAKENVQDFFRSRTGWKKRLRRKRLRRLSRVRRRRTAERFVTELAAFTQERPARWNRLRSLASVQSLAGQAAYRLDARVAAVLRVRLLFVRAAGQALLSSADDSPMVGVERLRRCEDFSFDMGR